MEFGKMMEKQDGLHERFTEIEEKLDKILGNGLIKRIRRLEYTMYTFIGGIGVLVFLIKEWGNVKTFLGL